MLMNKLDITPFTIYELVHILKQCSGQYVHHLVTLKTQNSTHFLFVIVPANQVE